MTSGFDSDEEEGFDSWEDDDFLDDFPADLDEPFEFHGNKAVIGQLNSLISSGRMPHALLFTGEQGIGKHTLAEGLAYSLLKGQKEIGFPKADATYARMKQRSHSDYLNISGADNEKSKQGNISVEQIRKIGGFLSKTTGESPMRVIIIDGAESMNTNASNALLKNLEEPPSNTLIMLVSHNSANLLPTIRSRVQLVKFSPLSAEDCSEIIRRNVDNAVDYNAEDIALISELADARPGLALKWLEFGAVDIYRSWLKVVSGSDAEMAQLERVANFAGELTNDKKTIHQNMEVFSALLLLFIKRAALAEKFNDQDEAKAIALFKERSNAKEMVSAWFLLKDQFSLVQKLHLEYKNTLITMLLRIVRGQPPLEIL